MLSHNGNTPNNHNNICKYSLKQYIKTETNKQKKPQTTSFDIKLIHRNGKTQLKDYDHKQNQIHSTYLEIRNDTNDFKKDYDGIISKNNNNDYLQSTFHDLILDYKNKGYKIPNLATNHNLFEASPLLLEENKLEEFYHLKEFQKRQRKLMERDHKTKAKTKHKLIKRDEGVKGQCYLTKINKLVHLLRFERETKRYGKKHSSIALVKPFKEIKPEANNDTNEDDNPDILHRKNRKLMKEIGILRNSINYAQKENEVHSPKHRNKRAQGTSVYSEDQMMHTNTTTFNSSRYTSIANETIKQHNHSKQYQSMTHKDIPSMKHINNLQTNIAIKSKTKARVKAKTNKPTARPISSHFKSRNYQHNTHIPISFSDINDNTTTDYNKYPLQTEGNIPYDNPSLSNTMTSFPKFSLQKEDFLNQLSQFKSFDKINETQYDDIIHTYCKTYLKLREDKTKQFIHKSSQKEPISLLRNINRFQSKIQNYDIKAHYPLQTRREIKRLKLINDLDHQGMKLDKLLGKNIIKIDNI